MRPPGGISALVKRAKRRDTEAFAELYGHYFSRVLFIIERAVTVIVPANQLLRFYVESSSEELAQETFRIAFEKLHQLRNLRHFLPWLRRIAIALVQRQTRNLSTRYERMRKRRFHRKFFYPPAADVVAEHDEHKCRLAAVLRAINLLEARYRDVILAFYFEGMSLSSIARRSGVSLGTVLSRIHRARLRLQVLVGVAS